MSVYRSVFHSSVFFFYFFYLLITLIHRLVRFLLALITVNRSYSRTYECSHQNHMITIEYCRPHNDFFATLLTPISWESDSMAYQFNFLPLSLFLIPSDTNFRFPVFSRSFLFGSLSCDKSIQDLSSFQSS